MRFTMKGYKFHSIIRNAVRELVEQKMEVILYKSNIHRQ